MGRIIPYIMEYKCSKPPIMFLFVFVSNEISWQDNIRYCQIVSASACSVRHLHVLNTQALQPIFRKIS